MSATVIILLVVAYFLVLVLISRFLSRGSNPLTFYNANKSSSWLMVAIGMTGTSLSGVTFISIPGDVVNSNWHIFQLFLGYIPGYLLVAHVLLPIYYRLNLVSIYTYFVGRFGRVSYRTGSSLFLVSRLIGASFRLYIVTQVLHIGIFKPLELPFWLSVVTIILFIWYYTRKAGIKTIVFTDVLQTFLLLASLVVTVNFIQVSLGWDFSGMVQNVVTDSRSTIFDWNFRSPWYFPKQFVAGMFIAVVMTGMDQDLMQKNLTCKNLVQAQKNLYLFSGIYILSSLFFLFLGVALYQYAEMQGISIPEMSDKLFPYLAIHHFSPFVTAFFVLGILAAAVSSADSALTSLTTSFCIDILDRDPAVRFPYRHWVHLGFSLILSLIVVGYDRMGQGSVVRSLFTFAAYTYGPLLGLFVFGIFTRKKIRDSWVPVVCIVSPILSWLLAYYSPYLLGGYRFGFEVLLVNGGCTFAGLWLLRDNRPSR